MIGILKLVAVRLKDYWPPVRITVILVRNAGEGVAAYDGVLREPVVWAEQRGPEGDRHNHLVLFRAVLGRDLHLVHLGGVFQEQLQPAPVTPKTSSARQEPRSRRLKRQGKRNREENERCWKTDYPNSRVRCIA